MQNKNTNLWAHNKVIYLYPIFNANKNTNLWAHNKVISLVLIEQSRYTYIFMQDKQIQVNFLLGAEFPEFLQVLYDRTESF